MYRLVGFLLLVPLALAAPLSKPTRYVEWPMFGGTPQRNMVNRVDAGLSHLFDANPEQPNERHIGERLAWQADLGSVCCSQPVVAGGQVFVGTNNQQPRNSRDRWTPTRACPEGRPKDYAVLMCFAEDTGKFLWQMLHDVPHPPQLSDVPNFGLWTSPVVEGERLYYVAPDSSVVCLDVHGFANGNQGVQTERHTDTTDGDVLWSLDLTTLGVKHWHHRATCSPLIVGDILFVVTGSGMNEAGNKPLNTKAPSFLALSKHTGKVLWSSNLPGGEILEGHWSNPVYGEFAGERQIIFPGGDGWLYGFEVETGQLLWRFDANPKDAVFGRGNNDRSHFMGTPVIYAGKIYVGTGRDPEQFEGVGHLWCLNPASKRGDLSPTVCADPPRGTATKPNPNSAVVWHYGGLDSRPHAKRDYAFGRTLSTACIVDDVLYMPEYAGYVHCLDARTGKLFWCYDAKSAIWGSCYYVDGKVLLGTEDSDIFFFKHEKPPRTLDRTAAGSAAAVQAVKRATADGLDDEDVKKQARDAFNDAAADVVQEMRTRYLLQKLTIDGVFRSTPVVAKQRLYLATGKMLYAVKAK